MVTNVAYELQTSKVLIIGFDTPAVIQTSCEPLENLVATRAADPRKSTETMVVGLPLRGVRVFRQFSRLGVDSVKVALSHPAHQRVTRAIGLPHRHRIPKNIVVV